ncbi:hypothetical protein JCM8547_002135 [Rhodosporidiobolus lusitaniae]
MAQPLLNLVVQLRSWKLEAQLLAALPRLRSHLRVLKAGDRMYSAHELVRVIASCLSELRYERPYGLKEEQWTSFTCFSHLTLTRYRFKNAFPILPHLLTLSLHGVSKDPSVALRPGLYTLTRSDPLDLTHSALPNLKALYLSGNPLPNFEDLGDQLDMVQLRLKDRTLYSSCLCTASFPVLVTLNLEDAEDSSLPPGIPATHLQLDSCPDLATRYFEDMSVIPIGHFHPSFRLHSRLTNERGDVLKECKARGIDVIWCLGSRKPEDDLEVSREFWQYAREEQREREFAGGNTSVRGKMG